MTKINIDYYLSGEWDTGGKMRPLYITKEDAEFIDRYRKIPESFSPLKTSDFKTVKIKVIRTTYYPSIKLYG